MVAEHSPSRMLFIHISLLCSLLLTQRGGQRCNNNKRCCALLRRRKFTGVVHKGSQRCILVPSCCSGVSSSILLLSLRVTCDCDCDTTAAVHVNGESHDVQPPPPPAPPPSSQRPTPQRLSRSLFSKGSSCPKRGATSLAPRHRAAFKLSFLFVIIKQVAQL